MTLFSEDISGYVSVYFCVVTVVEECLLMTAGQGSGVRDAVRFAVKAVVLLKVEWPLLEVNSNPINELMLGTLW